MSLNVNFLKFFIPCQLKENPGIRNTNLAKAIAAELPHFQGSIRVSDCRLHSFSSNGYEGDRKPAKIIYLSPYSFWVDLLVTIKRIFTGVIFAPSFSSGGNLLPYLLAGRRITVYCALDGTRAETLIEQNQKPLWTRLYQSVFR